MSDYQQDITPQYENIPCKTGDNTEETRGNTLTILSQFFDNKHLLGEIDLETLIPEEHNLIRLKRDKNNFELFQNILAIYKESKSKNSVYCFKICASMELSVSEAIKKYWSTSNLEINKDDLSIDDFSYETLRQIGALIEACLQPLLLETFNILSVCESNEFTQINKVGLGKLIIELIQNEKFAEHLNFTSYNIPLNQIRNICQHLNFTISEGIVSVSYSNGKNKVSFTRVELQSLFNQIVSLFNAFRLARVIFNIDNILEISPYIENKMEHREEQILLTNRTALEAVGIYSSIEITDNEILIELIDQHPSSDARVMLAINKLINIWKYTTKEVMKIKYTDVHKKYEAYVIMGKDSATKFLNKELSSEQFAKTLIITKTKIKLNFREHLFQKVALLFEKLNFFKKL